MAGEVMLCPNPNRDMAVDRVVIVGRTADKQFVRVLNVGAIEKDPTILKPLGKGHSSAATFWNFIAIVILISSIVASFMWHWWAFLIGVVATFVLIKANQTSVVGAALEIVASDPGTIDYFTQRGLVWEARAENVVSA